MTVICLVSLYWCHFGSVAHKGNMMDVVFVPSMAGYVEGFFLFALKCQVCLLSILKLGE